MRKFLFAALALSVSLGVAFADITTGVVITKVDGTTVEGYKKGKKGAKGDSFKLEAAKDVKVNKAGKAEKGKPPEAGDPIDGGLKADVLSKIGEKGQGGWVVTDDDFKTVKQIIVATPKKPKDAK